MKFCVANVLSYRRRKLLLSSIKRALRWEFWPIGIFYIPVVVYILGLVVRYKGLAFTAVNPGLPGSGFIGENKSLSLLQLQHTNPDNTAKTLLVPSAETLANKWQMCQSFMADKHLSFPIVVKPDFGQRGLDVEIAADEQALKRYLEAAIFDTVVQEYIPGVEFGVFYVRQPDEAQGRIFSLTHKCFPELVGDGRNTVEVLICQHPRLHYMAAFLFDKHKAILNTVPAKGEKISVVNLGSHCRGSLFLEGKPYLTDKLSAKIDVLSQEMDGFYFGRYDIRASDIDAFSNGDVKVIEVNGVTSESTNIYDPSNNVLTAYKILFQQWRLAFEIGEKNIALGNKSMTIGDLMNKVRIMNHGT